MTKTKAQLRAEAVERLRGYEVSQLTTLDGLVRRMFGWNDRYYDMYELRDALIDLLTDNEPQDEQDSREKLEEDCEKLIGNIQRRVFSGRDAGALRCQLEELLDRQAAITTQECTDVYESGCEACRRTQKREIAELREKLSQALDHAHAISKLGELD